jgi:DNA polymerase I-like protein with 3'-5' exonuclease and polymerase domains
LEADFKSIEVAINACYNKDTNLIKYVSDPTTDMHRDMAKQIFILDEFDKVKHDVLRQAVKNGFVFPEFYGDYYINCAENMACSWGKLPKGKWLRGQGIPLDTTAFTLADHMIAKGISSLTQFENHLKKIEKDFWENRFPEYDEWKDRWWRMYKKYGYVDTFLGFRFSGIMDRKQCVNYPVQATAFHYLLSLLIEIDKVMGKENWKSKIICQIHDSILFSMEPDELLHIVETIKQIMEEFSKKFDWLIVPMEISGEICEIDHSWAEKEKIKF